jgi:predicted esterase
MTERTIATTVHGRYLVAPANTPAGLLVGFHGYGENAETQLDRLRAIPGSNRWTLVSIQGLNRFYERRTDRVVASWMTRQDRELTIADNLEYVAKCLDAAAPASTRAVFAGFSQGVAMAFRAAGRGSVIAVGGDVPPELDRAALSQIQSVLLVRGTGDTWYTKEQFSKDAQRLEECGVRVRAIEIDAAHEWPGDSAALGEFLL